jgi:hypothetical protein
LAFVADSSARRVSIAAIVARRTSVTLAVSQLRALAAWRACFDEIGGPNSRITHEPLSLLFRVASSTASTFDSTTI